MDEYQPNENWTPVRFDVDQQRAMQSWCSELTERYLELAAPITGDDDPRWQSWDRADPGRPSRMRRASTEATESDAWASELLGRRYAEQFTTVPPIPLIKPDWCIGAQVDIEFPVLRITCFGPDNNEPGVRMRLEQDFRVYLADGEGQHSGDVFTLEPVIFDGQIDFTVALAETHIRAMAEEIERLTTAGRGK